MIDKKENIEPKFLKLGSCTNPTTGKTLEFVDKRPAVMAAIINSKQEVLMVEQYRCGADDTIREFVAGVIEEGQTPEDALYAEMRQEAGIKKEDVLDVHFVNKLYSSVGWTNEISYLYVVTLKDDYVQQDQQLDEGENLIYKWVPLQEVINYLLIDTENKIIPAKTAFLIANIVCGIMQGQIDSLSSFVKNHFENGCTHDCSTCNHEGVEN